MNIQGRDFRFRPDAGEFEAESGQTQYGRHRDDWGNWFGNNNPNWAWHFVLSRVRPEAQPVLRPARPPADARARHPALSRPAAPWPGSTTPAAANHVTSANSPTPYRDDLFGPGFATSIFVSEPVHNLVHRMVLEPHGATYRGVRRRGRTGSRVPCLQRQLVPAYAGSRPDQTVPSGWPTCTAR